MRSTRRPDHLRAGPIALVAAGGAVGTALRAGIGLLVHPVGGFPVAVFGINLVGAFVLGALLQTLTALGPDVGRRRTLRLFVGTGVLGGFTTYSALSADSAVLLTSGGLALALGYGLATVLLGALASAAGIALGARLGSPRGRYRMPVDADAYDPPVRESPDLPAADAPDLPAAEAPDLPAAEAPDLPDADAYDPPAAEADNPPAADAHGSPAREVPRSAGAAPEGTS